MLLLSTLALAAPAVAAPQFRIRSHFGPAEDYRLGRVAAAGDIDGDGAADYLIAGNVESAHGEVQLISGASGAVLFAYVGAPGDALGSSATGLGDQNGDGVPDFAIGAPGADFGAPASGRVWVHSGADGSVLRTHDGTEQGTGLGFDLARAGDVDGDGVEDLIVGAPGDSVGNGYLAGRVSVYSGATGALLHSFPGGGAYWSWGASVSTAGDVDGDGRADILAGSSTPSRIRVYSGATGSILLEAVGDPYTARLGEDLAALGDVNGDGFDDFAASAPNGGPIALMRPGLVRVYSGATGAVLYDVPGIGGASAGGFDNFGSAIAAVGDWNSDGIADFAARSTQRVEVRSGVDGALLATPLENYFFGIPATNTLAGPGDLDGDGHPDLLVGHPLWDNGPNSPQGAGQVMALSGRERIGVMICTQLPTQLYGKRILSAQGSTHVGSGDVVLSVKNLVPGSNGYFVTSKGSGVLVRPGGAWGDLCIHDPGSMGRHFDSLGTSDASGMFQFKLDLSQIPTPLGLAGVVAGETRYWQLWHRDSAFNQVGSNFSSAVGITFQ